MAIEAAQAIVRKFCNVSDAELSNADINWLHREIANRFASLESELAALRQVVADVETCRGAMSGSVNIFVDYSLDATRPCIAPNTERVPARGVVLVVPANPNFPTQEYWGPTWQAALHAAAEHVRNTNPERNDP